MLVPGFTVQELPVKLSNINNLRFAPDGRLTALGYDGRIHLLRDTNGDGLEDEDELFWDKPTLSAPVGMAWSKGGLYVSSHGKVSLLRDTNHDGRADTEEIIASAWLPTDVASGGADALGVTLDKDGNVYFGLVTPDYSNPYRIKDGISRYDVNGIRGTIQKWNRRTRKLETVATGIRVPYALLFNNAGDLFCTDQEGETWCPNGNPLDELNHIIPGRNYGFPPRHEKWLPNLISEPPVVAFGPQHQSTCGFVFNEAESRSDRSPGRKLFGPKWWEGDAFVAGESRGKIWRVRLVKTPHGYVGKEFLIARLSMLTTDVTISPKGDLYVSCHSGPPDWGTGPQGEGRIFKISYTDPTAPQPVIAWEDGPIEVCVAFDKAVDPSVTNAIVGQQIEFGEYVRAADRYEVLKPPYQVVKQQEATGRGRLAITAARLDDGDQMLVLTTERHPSATRYALSIPAVKAKAKSGEGETLEVEFSSNGAKVIARRNHPAQTARYLVGEKIWQAARLGDTPFFDAAFSAWIPHPDLELSLKISGQAPVVNKMNSDMSSTNSRAFYREMLRSSDDGTFWFRLRPPADATGLVAVGEEPFSLGLRYAREQTNASVGVAAKQIKRAFVAKLPLDVGRGNPIVTASSRRGINSIRFALETAHQPRPRPLSLDESYPTSVRISDVPSVARTAPIGFIPGDFERGRSLFFSDQLKCSTCHRIRDEGGAVGADLSNLVSRDAASVLRDIKEPSAAINPDYVTYNVVTSDGTDLTGFVKAQEANALRLITVDGKEHVIPRGDIKEMRVSSVSLMPAGLLDALKEEQVRDLLTFLLSEPPKRTRAEVEAVLNAAENRQSEIANWQLHILLVASKQDHGPGQHDYPAWQQNWQTLLGRASNVVVSTAWEWPSKEQIQTADVIVFYYWNHDWNTERYQQLDEFLARGGGVALFHSATIADKDPEQLAERIGLASQPQRTKYLHTPLDLKIVVTPNHPITLGLPRQIHFLDEPYWPMIGDASKVEVLATTPVEGEERPMIWTWQKGKGRVFASILGHYTWTFEDPLFRILALRGIAWAGGESDGRLEELATTEVDLK